MKTTVGILLIDRAGKYLLQMRDGTEGICNPLKWNFFGGGRNEDEDVTDAAIRELEEELGITAGKDDFKIIGETIFPDGEFYTLTQYMHPISWKDFSVNEGAGAAFFSKEELSKIDMTSKTKIIIERIYVIQ